MQGSYLDIPLMREAIRFDLLLSGSGSTYGYVGLSEVEIYAAGEHDYDRWVDTCLRFEKNQLLLEPHHEKTCLCHMRTTKAQISLRIQAG